MKPNSLYNASVKMIAALHCERRGFWHSKWVEDLTPDQAEDIFIKLRSALDSLAKLRDTINDHTLSSEPEELELEDDGEQHLRNMEAFAMGGMKAVNEGMNFHTDPPVYDPDY